MASGRVTLQTIADQLHVSKVTVHKALTHKNGVSEEMRKKIFSTAAALGYITQSEPCETQTFLYLFPKRFFFASEPFYTVIFYHLEQLSLANNFELKLIVIDEKEYADKLPGLLQDLEPAGIFIGGEIERPNIHYLETLGLPLVFIDFYSNRYRGSYVFADNFHGAYYLTKYLIERGHRRIAFVGDPHYSDSDMDRFFGYQKALCRNRIPIEEDLLLLKHIDNLSDLSQICLPEVMPSAFLCHSAYAALEICMKLQVLNLRIPEDVSVVTFDNVEATQKIRPQLTACGVSQNQFAEQAWQLMQLLVHNPQGGFRLQSLQPVIYEHDSVRDLNAKES